MKRRSAFLLIFFLTLAAEPLSARQRLADIDTRCPLFGHEFTAQAVAGKEEFAAFDSDLCKRPQAGNSLYILSLWTCPYCFFSAYQADFSQPLDPKYRDMELRTYRLDKPPSEIQQYEIFVGVKFHNAETFYRLQGRDAWFLYDLMLRGTYACRVTQVEETKAFRKLRESWIERAWTTKTRYSTEEVSLAVAAALRSELDKKSEDGGRAELRYLLADSLRQAGEHREAAKIFDDLLAEGGLGDVEARGARLQRALCQKEQDFQESALAYLEQAQKEDLVPASNRTLAVYLRGELERRLGRFEAARESFRRAASMPAEQEWLGALIEKQQGRLPSPEPGRESRGKGN